MKKHTFLSLAKLLAVLLFSQHLFAQESDSFLHLITNKNLTDNKDLSDFSVSYIEDNSNISIMNFSGNYDRNINGSVNVEARQAITQEFYRVQPDQFDFLVIFTTFPVDSGEAAAFAISYENDVQGIGRPIYDTSFSMGSERLQTTIDMTEISGWELNPGNRQFDKTLGTLMHEMMHRWGISVNFEDENNQLSDLLRGRDDVHWNYFLNTNASLMYGSLWNDIGAGQFETLLTSKSLSPLDLYLMGFREPASVPDFFLIDEGVPGNRIDIPSSIGTQVIGNRVEISIDNIIAAEGARIPVSTDAQHKFNFKFILLKQANQQVSASEIGSLLVLQREFQKRFFAETGGIGEILYPDANVIQVASNPITLSFDESNLPNLNLTAAELFLVTSFVDTELHWKDKPATEFRDTAMALKTLSNSEHQALINSASDWLNSIDTNTTNNDDLAWLVLSQSINLTKKNAIIQQFLDSLNNDSGWGLQAGSSTSSYDTALVLKAMSEAIGPNYVPSADTLQLILRQFNSDGGMGYSENGKSSLTSSALFLSTFYDLTRNPEMEQSLINFIVNQQHPDGGFGEEQTTAHETALVIQSLSNTFNQGHFQAIENAKDKLTTMQSIDGSFEGSVYSTALALQVLIDAQKPNLNIGSAQLSNNQAVAGEQISIEFTISNLGETSAENVALEIFNDQQVIATELFPLITEDQSISGRLTFDTSTMLGVEYLELFIDPQNAIIETNEADNLVQLILNVEPQSQTPELAIDHSSIIFSTDYFDALPLEFTASFEVSNLSTTDLTGVKVGLFKVIDEFNREELQSLVLDINANQNQMFSFNTTIAAAEGDLELAFVIDPEDQITEVNELNNELKTILSKLSTIDLSITEPQITVPNQFILGQQVDLSFEFSNLGTQLSPGFGVTAIYHGSVGEQLLYENQILEMLGGQHLSRQLSWIPTELGEYSIEFIVDQYNSVPEINEDNNSITIPISVAGNTSTNLQINDQDVTINPEPGLTGQALEINALIKNNSNTGSGPFDVSFFQQQVNQPSQLIETSINNSSIPAGGEITVGISVNNYEDFGDVTFIAQVDPNSVINEFEENDNIGSHSFRILNKPDAMVSAGGFSMNPSVPVLGELLHLEASVANLGEQPLNDLDIRLYTKSGEQLTEIDSQLIQVIDAGQSQIAIFDFIYPNDSAVNELVIYADMNNTVDEIDENNNTATLQVENQNRQLYVSEKYFSPNGDGIKDQTQIVFNLDDVDDYKIQVVDESGESVRTFSTFANTSYGDVFWDGRNDAQKVVRDGEYRIEVSSINSSFNILISVILDTNRSTVLAAIYADEGIYFDLNCALSDLSGFTTFSGDGKFIYAYQYTDKQDLLRTGFYRIKTDGSKVESLLPASFTNGHSFNINHPFYVLNNGEILLYVADGVTGDTELWLINPIVKTVNKLSTEVGGNFNIEAVYDQFALIKINMNFQFDFYKISYDVNTPSQQLNFRPNSETSVVLKKLSHGWFWEARATDDSYNYYYDLNDDLSNTQLLENSEFRMDLSVSNDGNYLTTYSKTAQRFRYYRVGNGQLINLVDEQFNDSITEAKTYDLRENEIIQLLDSELRIYDKTGNQIISEPHSINLSYFQQLLIDQFGSLDTLIAYTEVGEVIYAYDDIENLEIKFDSVKISEAGNKEIYIGFGARLEGEVLIDSNGANFIYDVYLSADRLDLKIDYQHLNDVDIEELEAVIVQNPKLYEALSPQFSMYDSIYTKNSNIDVNVGNSPFWNDYQVQNQSPDTRWPDVIKKLHVFSGSAPESKKCTLSGDPFNGIYQSRKNLTTFLTARVESTEVEISGSAFDANFDHYILEWKEATDNNNNWQILKDSELTRTDEFLMYWVPSVAGNYQIRLSAFDQAGNHSNDQVNVYISNVDSTLSNPNVYPEHFSPNGDGVQDQINIEFNVLQATDVNIVVKNNQDQVVRTIVREYTQPESAVVEWDGLGNSGQSLPDGYYTIGLNQFMFQVVLDTEAPDIFYGPSEDIKWLDYTPSYPWLSGVSVYFDASDEFTLQNRLKANSIEQVYDEEAELWQYHSNLCGLRLVKQFAYDDYYGSKFRCTSTDLAGNTADFKEVIIEVDPLHSTEIFKIDESTGVGASSLTFECNNMYPNFTKVCDENFSINNAKNPIIADWNQPGNLFLRIEPFTNKTVSELTFKTSYYPEGSDPNLDDPVESVRILEFADSQKLIDFRLLNENIVQPTNLAPGIYAFLEGGGNTAYFIELIEEFFPETDSIITNTFKFSFEDGSTHSINLVTQFGQGKPEIFTYAYDLFTRGIDDFISRIDFLDSEDTHLIDSLEHIIDSVEYDQSKDYWMFIKDAEEGISNPRIHVVGPNDDVVIYEHIFYVNHLVDAEDNGYVIYLFEFDDLGCVFPKVTFTGVREDGSEIKIEKGLGGNRTLCLDALQLKQTFLLEEQCNELALIDEQIRIEVDGFIGQNSSLPASLEIYRLVEGEEVLLFLDTDPDLISEDGKLSYRTTAIFDKGLFAQGTHWIFARFKDIEGNEYEIEDIILVQDQPVRAEISQPLANQTFCATASEEGNIPVDVELIFDNNGAKTINATQFIGGVFHKSLINYSNFNNPRHGEVNDTEILTIHNGVYNKSFDLDAHSYAGEASVVIESINSAGVSHCTAVSINVDSLVDVSVGFIDEVTYLSPLGTGYQSEIQFADLVAHEAVQLKVEVFGIGNVTDNGYMGTLYDLSLNVEESINLVWDGEISGSLLSDGNYQLIIELTDDCGIVKSQSVSIVIDTTFPLITFVNPFDGEEVSPIIDVSIDVLENNFDDDQVELAYQHQGVWIPISIENIIQSPINLYEIQAGWNLSQIPVGAIQLKLTAADLAGNEIEQSIQVNNNEQINLFWAYQSLPRFFSPNEDQVKDFATINFGLNLNATVSLAVIDQNQEIVKQLLNDETLGQGTHEYHWLGLNNLGETVTDGEYQMVITASETGNATNIESLTSKVNVDNTAPVVTLTPSSPLINGTGFLQLNINENYLSQAKVWLQKTEPSEAEMLLLETGSTGSFNLISLEELTETTFQLRVEATDLAGNKLMMLHAFEIDNTPPEIRITSPVDMSLQGGDDDSLIILGDVIEKNFAEVSLFVSPVIDPVNWDLIFTGSDLLEGQFNHEWPINVDDGVYLIKALAIDQAGLEAETSHQITLDRQAPIAILSQPLNQTNHGANIEIDGTANDLNLSYYHLSYKLNNQDDTQWEIIHSGIEPVIDGPIFSWVHDLPSGSYQLRLLVVDKSGLESLEIVNLELDTQPPATATYLEAELINGHDVTLTWQPSSSEDVAGYWVYRNNSALNQILISEAFYSDISLAEGEYTYWVVAEDDFGNLSAPSNTDSVLVDETGPDVYIQSPINGQLVSGVIDVSGTASSSSDFHSYQLYYRSVVEPAPGTLLSQSTLPASNQILAQLDTRLIDQNQNHIIRLEARDISQNLSVVEHTIVVDNSAPSAPLNLIYQLSGGNDVELSWGANNESDLVGYVVFRNGVIISGNGTVESSIITETDFIDPEVVDGLHTYFVVAVDQANNISTSSNTVEVNIDLRAPHAYFTAPSQGQKFEAPIRLSTTTDDTDVASVLFEYSTDGLIWNTLTNDQTLPFEVLFNANDLGLSFGSIHIQATATDNGSLSDPTPDQLLIEYTDLTPPESVQSLQAVALGDEVHLSWDANIETDLQGYQVSRKQIVPNVEIEFTDLNNDLLATTVYVDLNLNDGVYIYRVVAVDEYENESDFSQFSEVQVFAVILDQPFSPVMAPSDVVLEGLSPVTGNVNTTLDDINGSQVLPITQAEADEVFNVSSPLLTIGENSFTVIIEDDIGNQSKPENRSVEVSPTPLVPLNPQFVVDDYEFSMNWQAPDLNTIGYLPYLNNTPIYDNERLVSNITVNSSSNSFLGLTVLDGDEDTLWVPSSNDINNGQATFLELHFAQPKWVKSTAINWDEDYYYVGHVSVPSTYLLQYLSPVGWITQADFTGSVSPLVLHESEVPYLASAIRIWMPLVANNNNNIRLSEVFILHQPYADQLIHVQTLSDGHYEWQVSSINQYGFESERTAAESFTIGDVLPPDAVILNGQVENGNSAQLNWSASSSVDVAQYRVFRNNELIVSTTGSEVLNHLDENLANGGYSYYVVAVDAAGNSSESSNSLNLNISQQILDPPTGLSIDPIETGGALLISWNSHVSPDWAAFKVYRSLDINSAFIEVESLLNNSWLDEELNDGMTYYYFVTAIDILGNESQPSLIVSGIPNDLIAPIKPVITKPTVFNVPITVNALTTDISGLASAAVTVDLYRNGLLVDSVLASANFSQTEKNLNRYFDDPRFNGNNNRFVYYDSNSGEVAIADPEIPTFTALNGLDLREYFWSQDGTTVYAISGYGDQSELKSFDLNGAEITTHLTGFNITLASVSADESQLLYWGDGLNPDNSTIEYGLWLYTFTGSVHKKIELNQSVALFYDAIQWLPDGRIVFINFPNGIFNQGLVWIYDIQNNLAQMLVDSTTDLATLRASSDATHLYFDVDENGYKAVKRYRISDGETLVLGKNAVNVSMPLVGDDADLVFVNVDCCNKELINIETGEVVLQIENTGFSSKGSWLDDGTITVLDNDVLLLLSPPGTFEFNDVELSPGLNEFYVTSMKSNGLTSPVSDPIEVSLNSSILPDLVIEPNYVQIIPTQVVIGEIVSGSLLVKNASLVAIEGADLLIELIDPELNIQIIPPSPYEFDLSAGELFAQNFTLTELSQLGEYVLRVTADYNQQLLETNETNNSIVKVFQVVDDLIPDISLNLTSHTVFPGSDLIGQIRVYNPGTDFNGSVVLRITDSDGFSVGYEESFNLPLLNAGSDWESDFSWNSSDVFAGEYLVEVTLYDQNQQLVAQQIESFNVSEIAEFSLSLTTTATQVPINQAVNLLADVNYLSGNVSQSGMLTWKIFDEAQQLIWSDTTPTSVMSSGFSGSYEKIWNAGLIGTYQASVTLVTSLVTETAVIPFEIVPITAELSLSGLIDDLPAGVILGQTWHANFVVQNNGQIDVSNVPISLSLWTSELSQLIDQQNTVITLTAGSSSSLLTVWDSIDLSLGNYVLVLTADLSAQGESATYLLDTLAIQTVDISGPQINIINPIEQNFYLSNLELRAVIIDLYSAVESVDINLDGNAEVSFQGQQLNDVYQYWLTGLVEGEHQVNLIATDTNGNASNQLLNFNVDNTSPIIIVTGVSDGGLYNNSVQATVAISDTNLSTSQIILDGVPYISGNDISAEGNHILMVSATDQAGNTSTTRLSFNIDLTAPIVIVTYPDNNSETNQTHTVVSGTTEVNAAVSLTSGSYTDFITADFAGAFSFSEVPLSSGNNTIGVSAVDLAGNLGQQTNITVTYVNDINVSGLITAATSHPLGQNLSVDWQITNLNDFNVSQLPVELNLYRISDNQLVNSDSQFIALDADEVFSDNTVLDSNGLSPGDHRIELRVEIDQIWQTLDDHLIALQDVVGPELVVVEPLANQVTQSTVNLLVQATDLHSQIDEVSYQLDGNLTWLPMNWSGTDYVDQLELTHGTHQIIFRALDTFANETLSSSVLFNVDTIAPVINVLSPADGLITNQAVNIDFGVTDDHGYDVDAQLNLISISSGDSVTEEDEYEMVINATDEVNNQSSVTRNFIIDTTAPNVTVTSPATDIQNTTGLINIIGAAEDRNVITVSVNGVENTLKTDVSGGFISTDNALQLGMNLIVVTATDQAGNVSQAETRNVEYIQVGSIAGRIWQDDDQDGSIDLDELGFNQVALKLTDSGQTSQNMLTDSDGNYQFIGLSQGTYTIEVVEAELLNEWSITTNNNPITVDVTVDQNLEINFGFYQVKPVIDARLFANSIKGRLLVLTDPPTAQVDGNQCIGVSRYKMQRSIDGEFESGDSVWANLYDDQGNLLQTETATFADFVNNNYQAIDQQAETSAYNLILHPVGSHIIKASVVSSSIATPSVIPEEYRLVLGIQNSAGMSEWSSDLLTNNCAAYTSIGLHSGELQWADVKLNPPLASDDPNGSDQTPHLITQKVLLEGLLYDAGWSYVITTDASAFEAEQSSGQYVAYWLMAENVMLTTPVQNNLMAAVDAGAGLLVSSGHDNLSAQFYSTLGVDVSGSHLTATEMVLSDSDVVESQVLSVAHDEQVLKVSLTDAMSAGVFNGIGINPPENQAVTWIDGEDGSSVFSGIDWLLQATDAVGLNHYADLIQTVLNYIHPLGLSNELGYARVVQLNMQNIGRPVNGYVQVLLPPMLTLVHAEIPVSINQDGFIFEYDLIEDELLELEFWLKVDTTPATITFEIHLDDNPDIFNSLDLTLVAGERPDISASITNCQAGVKPDQPLLYRYQVTNTGNTEVNAVSVFTEFDVGLQNPTWSCSGSLGGVCDQISGSGNLTGQSINLPVGSSVNFLLDTQLVVGSSSSVITSGYVLMPEGSSDVNPGNNSTVDFDEVYQFVFKNGFDCVAAGEISNKSLAIKLAKEGQ